MIPRTYRAGSQYCDQADLVKANSDTGAITITNSSHQDKATER